MYTVRSFTRRHEKYDALYVLLTRYIPNKKGVSSCSSCQDYVGESLEIRQDGIWEIILELRISILNSRCIKVATVLFSFIIAIIYPLWGCSEKKEEGTSVQFETTTTEETPTDSGIVDGDGDGFSEEDGDCDDGNAELNPEDLDQDGYSTCEGDCNDVNNSVYPGATEVFYNSIDENCDPSDDYDADGDGFASAAESPLGDDCDDENPSINPGATDIPSDGIDQDCDGNDYYESTFVDEDGDGFSEEDGDCDDGNPAINPGASDTPNDGIDQDCNGTDNSSPSLCDNSCSYAGDGFCDDGGFEAEYGVCSLGTDCSDCGVRYDYDGDGSDSLQDCNELDSSIHPLAEEICDGKDNNCDGTIDEGCN